VAAHRIAHPRPASFSCRLSHALPTTDQCVGLLIHSRQVRSLSTRPKECLQLHSVCPIPFGPSLNFDLLTRLVATQDCIGRLAPNQTIEVPSEKSLTAATEVYYLRTLLSHCFQDFSPRVALRSLEPPSCPAPCVHPKQTFGQMRNKGLS